MEKQNCCHIGCDLLAVNMITGKMGVGYDDTYMCEGHTDEYTNEDDKVDKLKHG